MDAAGMSPLTLIEHRVIPVLLLKDGGLVKGKNFKGHRYLGDPINAVKIYNEKCADELLFLDIQATRERRTVSVDLVTQLSDECLMPFGVGGGIQTVDEAKKLLSAGAEKVILNTAFYERPTLAAEIAALFGSQAVVVAIDFKRNLFSGRSCFTRSGTEKLNLSPVEAAVLAESSGAGEIFLQSIDRDGSLAGYELDVLKQVTASVSIPVIAAGGGNSLAEFRRAITDGGAAAAAAGAYFVFHGRNNAVLINYPEPRELRTLFAANS